MCHGSKCPSEDQPAIDDQCKKKKNTSIGGNNKNETCNLRYTDVTFFNSSITLSIFTEEINILVRTNKNNNNNAVTIILNNKEKKEKSKNVSKKLYQIV